MSNEVQTVEGKTDKQYEVEKILDRKIDKSECYYYHVQWVGYSQTTWEPLSNLLGSQAVERMVSEFEKTFQKKIKNNWSKGLAGWANVSKNPAKQSENPNKQDLDETFYKASDTDIIDLEKIDEPVTKKKRADENPFIGSRIRKKAITGKHQRYPFEKVTQSLQIPNFMSKILEIKKVEMIDGQSKCLATIKNPQPHEQWLPSDIVRLLSPQLLLQTFQKVHHQNQTKNNFK